MCASMAPRVILALLFAGAARVAYPQAAFPGQWAPTPLEWKYPVWPTGCDRFPGAERAACLRFIAFDYGTLARFAPANAAIAPPLPHEKRVVFLGDSITDNWSAPGFGGFFPGRPYVNRGIGGQTTSQMLLRFRADVVALRPKAVVIHAGTNDIGGNGGPVPLAVVEDNLAAMAELAKSHGIRVVLAAVMPVSDEKKGADGRPFLWVSGHPLETLRGLNRWMADYARANGHVYLDYFSATADARGLLRPDLTDDGLHPNTAGYAVLGPLAEQAIVQALR